MTTLLIVWGIGATALALFYRSDARWWKHECQRRTEKAIVPVSDGERPFQKATMPDRKAAHD